MFTANLNIQGLQEMLAAKDPVCGMDVEKASAAAVLTYSGETYYFCAEGCKKAFQADPKKYLK